MPRVGHDGLMEIETSANASPWVLLLVIGLEVEDSFTLGETRFFTHADGLSRITELVGANPAGSYFAKEIAGYQTQGVTVLETARTNPEGAIEGLNSIDDAIECARLALNCLRVLYTGEISNKYFPIFGLAGELMSGAIIYLTGPDEISVGRRRAGHIRGVTLAKDTLDYWRAGTVFNFLHKSLKDPNSTDATRRAILGTSLLSASVLERNPDVALVFAMSALEALVMPEGKDGKTLKLARHLAWFGCRDPEQRRCGRQRDACPCLLLNPDNKLERGDLQALQIAAQTKDGWRCAEWMRIVDWYDSRSKTVHGRSLGHSLELADTAQYWITTQLYQPILKWLAEHPSDPIGDLERALNTLSRPANWSEVATLIRERKFDSPCPGDWRRWDERDGDLGDVI